MKIIKPEPQFGELEIFEIIKKALGKIEDISIEANGYEGKRYDSTLIINSAIANLVCLRCVQGIYAENQHSWIVTNHGNIIDTNPIAGLSGPMFLDRRIENIRKIYSEKSDPFICGRYSYHIRLLERALRAN